MKVTIDGITYEGTEAEIRSIVRNPPTRDSVSVSRSFPDNWNLNQDFPRNWDGSPKITCYYRY